MAIANRSANSLLPERWPPVMSIVFPIAKCIAAQIYKEIHYDASTRAINCAVSCRDLFHHAAYTEAYPCRSNRHQRTCNVEDAVGQI